MPPCPICASKSNVASPPPILRGPPPHEMARKEGSARVQFLFHALGQGLDVQRLGQEGDADLVLQQV